MGHERLGQLPKSQQWTQIVDQFKSLHSGESSVPEIASQTIENVRSRFRDLPLDDGVRSAFRFLTELSHALGSPNPTAELHKMGLSSSEPLSTLQIAVALKTAVLLKGDSPEHSAIAVQSAIDAVSTWHRESERKGASLFEGIVRDPIAPWRDLSSAGGFCELTRAFFSSFTTRYLNYFLDRAASSAINDLQTREQFSRELKSHVETISHHAFETAKITQSFAAGWFNKHARQQLPTDREIGGFLHIAFGKMRDELLREAQPS